MKRIVSGIMLTLLFMGMLTLAFSIQQVKAEPKTIYVDASNIDDPLEDGTIDHPYDKIQEGIDATSSGDTVLVAAGTYYENVILKDGVQVLGAGADVTIIDGVEAENVVLGEWIVDPASVISGFTITNGQSGIHTKTYSLVTITNCIVTGNQGDGIKCENSNPTITDCTITDNGHGIGCEDCNPTISNCTITDNGGGIGIDRSLATITGCTLSGDGISVGPESFADITNCVIANGGVNVYDWYGGYTNNATITNCIIVGSDGSGIGGAYVNTVEVINCILWANDRDLPEDYEYYFRNFTVTYSDIEEGFPGEGNICAYPMFVNPGGGDFRLQEGSPCIDAGTNEGAPTEDIEGTARPIDGDGNGTATTDMGPYEYTGPPPPPPVRPAEVWVDDDWTGSNPGDPVDGHIFGTDAFGKIQDGINAVASPGTVHVAAGTYYENIIFKDGAKVLGAGADVTTINGSEAENVVLAEWIVDPASVFSGFTITNGQNGICVKRYSLITISNCVITSNQELGIDVKSSNPTITHCIVTGNQVHGINCENSNPTIMNCIVTDNGNRGIIIHSSLATITGCTLSRNVWFQIGVSAPTAYEHGEPKLGSSANITNCIITNGEHGGIDLYFSSANITNCVIVGFDGSGIGGGYGDATVINSILWANGDDLDEGYAVTYSDIEEDYPGEGNICAYPMFVNPGTGDYRLQAGSSCIDAGTNEDAPSVDFEGNPRPIDGDGDGIAVVDMGPYEFGIRTFDVVVDDIHYPVSIRSNSTVSDFNFDETEMQISFDVSGESGTIGYCNVTIPRSLLTGSPWIIKTDNTPITDFDEKTNATHTFLYFTYTHESPLQVRIEGTWVVPEFASATILPLFMILSLVIVVFIKRKKKKR